MLQLWRSPRCCHRTNASKLRLCFLKKMREKSSLKSLSVFCRGRLCVAHSPLSGSATFLSTDQLSHHSHFPPPRPPPPRWMILCLTLSPSPFVLFHWPCMFQKQISFSSTVQPPFPSPPPLPRLSCTTSLPNPKPCPQFLSKPTISPPNCTTSSPTHAPPSCPPVLEFGGVCHRGCPPIPGPLVV